MQENPRIKRQDRQNITFHGSAYPKEISQQCTPVTHTEAVHCQRVLLGSSIPVSDHQRLLDPPLGEGRQASHQLSDASTPRQSLIWQDEARSLGVIAHLSFWHSVVEHCPAERLTYSISA